MDSINGNNAEVEFANGQSNRDLRADSDPIRAIRWQPCVQIPTKFSSAGSNCLMVLDEKSGASAGSSSHRRIIKRVLLLVLLVLAVGAFSPFAWNYLQSYESTDDAQIDRHIDPLSSRINETVIRVYPENNYRVKAGELLVEIDPRDYEVVDFTEERKQARQSGHLRIDYFGIALIAIGFACLEVVLDRGERDDWLKSRFITNLPSDLRRRDRNRHLVGGCGQKCDSNSAGSRDDRVRPGTDSSSGNLPHLVHQGSRRACVTWRQNSTGCSRISRLTREWDSKRWAFSTSKNGHYGNEIQPVVVRVMRSGGNSHGELGDAGKGSRL
jgi:hypothetical protein